MRRLISVFVFSLSLLSAFAAAAQNTSPTGFDVAYERFLEKPSEQSRADLLAAVLAYEGPPSVRSVNGHIALMMHDAPTEKFDLIQETAGAAAAHLEPIADLIPKQYLDARLMYAIAIFNQDAEADPMTELAHVIGRSRFIKDDQNEWPEWAKKRHYEAQAWSNTMHALFTTNKVDHLTGEEFDAIIATYGDASLNPSETDTDALPLCEGEFNQRPKLRYPEKLVWRKKYGSVILELDLDAEGRVSDLRVLASVPLEEFVPIAERSIKKWKYRPKQRDQVGISCQLAKSGLVMPLTFRIR